VRGTDKVNKVDRPRRGEEVRPREGGNSKGGLREREPSSAKPLIKERDHEGGLVRENQSKKKGAINERGWDEASGGEGGGEFRGRGRGSELGETRDSGVINRRERESG
jgi:hypothetical protein